MNTFVRAESDWLQERYQMDAGSRNPDLLRTFLESFDAGRSVQRILDVGSGFGANFLFLAPRIPGRQHWLLLDRDNELIDKVNWMIQDRAQDLDRDGTRILKEALASGRITVDSYCGDFTDAASPIFEKSWDAVVANAVFDLNSQEQFRAFLRAALAAKRDHDLRLYFTLHLERGGGFDPRSPENDRYMDLFHQHMARAQDFGRAMGADCAKDMKEIMLQEGLRPILGASPWFITANERSFLKSNLNFLDQSIPDLLDADQRRVFRVWLQETEALNSLGRLQMTVCHQDHFARIPASK